MHGNDVEISGNDVGNVWRGRKPHEKDIETMCERLVTMRERVEPCETM